MKRRLALPLIIAAIAVGAFFQFGPLSSYSYHHPGLWHDCRMMAMDCAEGAMWVPNGGSSPLYKKCACSASTTAVTGG